MPMCGFTIGRDMELEIFDSENVPVPISLITSFESCSDYCPPEIFEHAFGRWGLSCWLGTIKIDRACSCLDDLFCDGNERKKKFTLEQTITELDGSKSMYRYRDLQFRFLKAGKYSGEKLVSQSVNWMASERTKLSATSL